MKPVFIINTSSLLNFEANKEIEDRYPIFFYNKDNFSSDIFKKRLKELYGVKPKFDNILTTITIIYIVDNEESTQTSVEKQKETLKMHFERISEIFYFQIFKHGSIEEFKDFLGIKNKRRLIFSNAAIPIYDFCFSKDIFNSDETILELKNLQNGIKYLVQIISLNYDSFIKSVEPRDYKIYSLGNAKIEAPYFYLKDIAIGQLESLIMFDFLNGQHLTEKEFNDFKSKIKNELKFDKLTYDSINDFELNHRNIIHGTKIHPRSYELLNNILPESEINTLLPNVSHDYLLKLYNERNQEINNLFNTLDYPEVREDSLKNNLYEQHTTFYKLVNSLFELFKNKNLLEIEDSFINRISEKKKSLTTLIEQNISEIFNLKKSNVIDQFGQTTSIEACIGMIDYISKGKSEYVTDAETESYDLRHIDKIIENFVSKGKTEQELHEKKIHEKENLNKQIENIVDSIQSNNNEVIKNYSAIEDIKSELILGFNKRKTKINRLLNFTKLTKIVTFTFLPVLLFVLFGLLFNNFNLKYYYFSISIPLVTGTLFLILLLQDFKNAKKRYSDSLKYRKSLYLRYLNVYDRYITNTLNIVRDGYNYKLLSSLKNYVNLKTYELVELRKHFICQLALTFKKFETYQNNLENPFIISPLSFNNYFTYILNKNISLVANDLKPFLNIYFKTFILNRKFNDKNIFELQKYKIGVFDESDASDIVIPLPEHKDQYYGSLSENKDDIIIFLKGKNKISAVDIEDIKQGEIGNCYFMAAIGAIANTNPEFIENMIYEKNDQYTLKFYNNDKIETFVTIDDKFWQDFNNIPLYAKVGNQDGDKKEIWPMLLEKAWAKINGGYSNIIGSLNNKMKIDYGLALTGNFLEYQFIEEDTDIDEIEKVIENYFINEKLPVTLSSIDAKCFRAGEHSDLVKNHAYVLKDYNPIEKTISIFNPHNINHYINVPLNFIPKNFDCFYLFKFKNPKWKPIIPPSEELDILSNIQLRCSENEYAYLSIDESIESISFKNLKMDEKQLKELALNIVSFSSPWINKNLLKKLSYDKIISSPERFVFLSDETNINEFDNQVMHNLTGNVQNHRIKTNADFEVLNLLTINLNTLENN